MVPLVPKVPTHNKTGFPPVSLSLSLSLSLSFCALVDRHTMEPTPVVHSKNGAKMKSKVKSHYATDIYKPPVEDKANRPKSPKKDNWTSNISKATTDEATLPPVRKVTFRDLYTSSPQCKLQPPVPHTLWTASTAQPSDNAIVCYFPTHRTRGIYSCSLPTANHCSVAG